MLHRPRSYSTRPSCPSRSSLSTALSVPFAFMDRIMDKRFGDSSRDQRDRFAYFLGAISTHLQILNSFETQFLQCA